MSKKDLDLLEKRLNLALKKQSQEGLAKVFELLSCGGVAEQIRKGRKVTENAEFGIRLCVHDKIGPRVNVETYKFTPQSKEAMKLEEKFIKNTNLILKNGGFREISPQLIPNMRKRDKEFEREIAKRRKELKK